jgi:sugar/nucleoside kinase (ribokinase family)
MRELNVFTHIVQKENPTGVSICLVTPDHERTMFTFLGACRDFDEDDVNFDQLKQSKHLHFTGYLWDTESQKKAIKKTIQEAKKSNLTISFDLADPFVVEKNKDEFKDLIPNTVNILFGNRDEFSSFLGKNPSKDEDLIAEAGFLAPLVLMKVGARGCYVNEQGRISHLPAEKVQVIDTIGAGDFFASGFLYGFIKGKSVRASAILANAFAAEIVMVEGCSLHKVDPYKVLSKSNSLTREPN